MITKITNWIDENLETCTASQDIILRDLMDFIITELKKEVAEMREAQGEA